MKKGKSTRDQIIESADRLYYQRGFEQTSFAEVASDVKISRGNFYHHFKSKDEILNAVIDMRLARTRAMLEKWESEIQDPKERILKFVHMLIMNQSKLKRYGCPVGTLCSELAKLGHISRVHANKLMQMYRVWLKDRFVEIGKKEDADELSLHLLARCQGISILAHAFNEEQIIQKEVRLIEKWLGS